MIELLTRLLSDAVRRQQWRPYTSRVCLEAPQGPIDLDLPQGGMEIGSIDVLRGGEAIRAVLVGARLIFKCAGPSRLRSGSITFGEGLRIDDRYERITVLFDAENREDVVLTITAKCFDLA